MSLTNSVISAIRQTKASLGDLLISMTLVKVTKTYSSGVNFESTTQIPVQGVIEKYTDKEIDGTMIFKDDLKIILFNEEGAIQVSNKDRIIANGKTFEVVQVKAEYVGAYTPIINLQVRL